uniref:Reverse transcriptase Ty1/copia-type domain-containing protein n=1 Tax=Anopheles atroparvus TaxID=41427 RepID=A0AAG5CP00_ANOAO
MSSLRDNNTWELVQLPPHRKAIGSKWIFKRKADEDGNLVRYKARLVAQGFSQKFGTDYDLVFAPVVKQITFRTMLVLASRRKMLTKHVDIKTAYLHGVLKEEIFMRQPPGYESGKPNEVCLLRRSIYGLKQAARVWNTKIDEVLKTMGFIQSTADPCLYIRKKANKFLFVLVYVDDVIVICNTEEEFAKVIHVLKLNFTISTMGNLKFFLGIRIRLDDGRYCIDQQAYLERVLERFGMRDAKPSKYPMDPGFLKRKEEIGTRLDSPIAYQSLIGALLYAAVTSRPDISIATAILGRRAQNPSEMDWNEAMRVLRYLKGTLNNVLYLGGSEQKLECFVDADWAGDERDRKSNSGFVFKFGGGIIGWGCHKQKCVALSSTEAEYVSLAECLQEVKWILKLMADVGEQLIGPVLVNEDNQSCIALTKGDRADRKAKHIDTKFNFVKDMVRDGIVQLQYCPTEHMQADLLTKPLQAVKLRQHREAIGIKPFSVEEEC